MKLWTTWEQTAANRPDGVAMIEARTGQALTRSELTAEAARLAVLAPPDFQPGEIVAFAARNGVQWLARFLASQKIQAVALPLDASLTPDHQADAARRLGAHWLINAGDWTRLSAHPIAGAFALVKTTSGSTGEPKALLFTADNMLADGLQICRTMEITAEDLNFGSVPFGHSYGLGNLILPLIIQGTAVASSDEMLPDAIAGQIERCGATVFPSAPAILRALAESSVRAERLRSLRRVISAGAPLPPAVAVRFRERFGLRVHNFYGSSETGGICFDRTGKGTESGRSVGTAMDGVDVQFSPAGQVIVRGAAVMGEGTHTLADLGHWNGQGELVLTGRASPLANIGGRKVAPQEIETALRGLDLVTDAWVGIGARPGGDYLLAAVETSRSPAEITRELREQLPGWKVPRRLWVTPALPRTARGKLDRAQLEARFAEA